MIPYEMEHLFTYSAAVREPVVVSPPGEGDIRINFYVAEGKAWGPKLKGRLLPVGADWMTLRTDGMAVLDVRAAIETDDGAHIDVVYNGLLDMGHDGYARFQKGEIPELVRIHAAPRLRTAHPDYVWLNRLQCVNVGEGRLRQNQVTYDVYALR